MSPQEIRSTLKLPSDKPAGFFDAPLTQKATTATINTLKSPEKIKNLVTKGFIGTGNLIIDGAKSYADYSQREQQRIKDKLNLPAPIEDLAAKFKVGFDTAAYLPREFAAGAVSVTKEVTERAGIPKLRSDEKQAQLEKDVFGREVPSITEGYVKPATEFADRAGSGSLEKFGIGAAAFGIGFIAENPYTGKFKPFKTLSKNFLEKLAKEADEAAVARELRNLPELAKDLETRNAAARLIARKKTPNEVRQIIENARRSIEVSDARVAGSAEAPQVVITKNLETGKDVVFRVRNQDLEKVREAIKNAPKTGTQPEIVTKSVSDLVDRGFEDGGVIGRVEVDQLRKQVSDLTGTVEDLTKPVLRTPQQIREDIIQPRTANGRFTFKPNQEAQTARAGRAGAKTPDNIAENVSNIAENSVKNAPDGGVRSASLKALRDNPDEITANPIELREIEDGRIVIVDGRHRLEVARETGVTPRFIDVTDQYPSPTGGTAKPSAKIANLIAEKSTPITPRVSQRGFANFSQMFDDVFGRKNVLAKLKESPEYERALSEIFAEFDIAQAGQRIINGGEVIASPSTFPKWIPEDLRSKKMMDKVLEYIDKGTEPSARATRERRLYDTIVDEIESRVGVYSKARADIPQSVIDKWDTNPAKSMKESTEEVRTTISNVNLDGEKFELEKLGIDPIKDTPHKAQRASQGEFNFFEVPEQTRFQYIRQQLQDKFERLDTTQKTIKKSGNKISEDADAFLQQELYVGRATERIDQMRAKVIRDENGKGTGLLERMRKDNITIDDMGRYLHAKHAIERNKRVAEINPDLPDGGSGLTNAEATKILKEFEGNENVVKYADEFRESVIKERIRILREEGLMTEEALAKIESAYENYVPLKVASKETRIGKSGKGFSAQGKDIKRVTGSTKERTNPVIQAIVDLEDTIIKAEKNKVGQSFMKLVRQNPNKSFWEVEPLKYAPRYNKEGEVIMLDPKYKFADNVMEVREGGKIRLITIHDKELAKAMKNLGQEKAISKVLMAFNSYLRGVITFYNPEFMLTNFQRDIQTALINVGGEKSAGMAKNVAKDIPSAMRGIYRETRGKKAAVKTKGTDWQAIYNEMKQEGGRVGWFDLNEVGERTSQTIKLIERYNSEKTVDSLRRGIDSLGKTVSDMNESVEMAVRVSTYKNLVESGMSKSEAARYAKNLTVNFNKKGNWGVMLNSLYLFANAGIQGTARIVTALRYPKVRAIVAGVAASAYAINHLNEAINEEGYNRLSDFEKDTNLILMLPPDFKPSSEEKKFIGGNDKDGYYLKLRLPYGYNIFKVLGDSAFNMTEGKKTASEEMKHLLMAMDTSFNPLSSGSLLQLASPTFSDPVVQQLENRNWFGGKIKPDQPAYQPAVRESSLYFAGATEQSKAVADWLNRVTGGNEVESGYIDVSPEIIDHYIDFIAGGVGDLFNATVDTGVTLSEGDMPDITEMPFVRKFIDKPFEQAEKFEMYDLLDKSATNKLPEIQRKRFLTDVGTAIETGQIDEDTGKKILKEFMKNEAKIEAGEIFSLYQSGKTEEALQKAGSANPAVDAAFRKLVEDKLKDRLEAAQK